MKKILALVLVLMISVGCFAGCGAPEEEAATEATKEQAAEPEKAATTDEPIELAFIGWGFADALSLGYKACLENITASLPVEVNWSWGEAADAAENIEVVDTMIQKGVDGIMCLYLTPKLVDLCTENEVYFASWTYFEDEVMEYCATSPYYVGTLHEAKTAVAVNSIQALLDRGCKEIVMMGETPGNHQHDIMWEYWADVLKDHPDVVTHEYKGTARDEAMKNFIALYPNIDGVIDTSSVNGYGDMTISAIRSEGKVGDIVYATHDLVSDPKAGFDDGIIAFEGAGTHASVGHVFILLLNTIMGTPLCEDGPATLDWNYASMLNTADYEDYMKYYEGDVPPVTAEEYEPFLKWIHPEASYEDFYKLGAELTLESVKEKHADLVK